MPGAMGCASDPARRPAAAECGARGAARGRGRMEFSTGQRSAHGCASLAERGCLSPRGDAD